MIKFRIRAGGPGGSRPACKTQINRCLILAIIICNNVM